MSAKQQPQRMCVACREMKDKKALIRVVKTPDEQLLIDVSGKKSGRGAYICPDEQCWKKARKSRSLEKALKTSISDEILEQLAAMVAAQKEQHKEEPHE